MLNTKYQNSVILLIVGTVLVVLGRLLIGASFGLNLTQLIWLVFGVAFNVLFFLYLYKYENTANKNLFFQIAFYVNAGIAFLDVALVRGVGMMAILLMVAEVAGSCLVAIFGLKRDKNVRIAFFALAVMIILEVLSNLSILRILVQGYSWGVASAFLWVGGLLGKIAAFLYIMPMAMPYLTNMFNSASFGAGQVNNQPDMRMTYEQMLVSLKQQYDSGLISPAEYEARKTEILKML
ncbi:MAG: SHOCT domain-containing protein [Clostridia bacterium]|nr:SHOCT domain-containing protein [Clostridia bacterium]